MISNLKGHNNFLFSLGLFILLIIFGCNGLTDTLALVINEPAFVYKKPDFDSEQIGQMSVGQKITVSSKKTGPFHKTRLRQGVIGWVSDADIQLATGKPGKVGEGPFKVGGVNGSEGPKVKKSGPWWSSLMMGFSAGMVRYTEVINKSDFPEDAFYFGIKLSIPVKWLDGPFYLDAAGYYHKGAPSYYESASEVAPTGFFVIGELPVLFQLAQFWGREGALFMGAGPMLNYSRFLTQANGIKQDLEELRVGAVGVAGMAFNFGKINVKLEAHYYLERANFLGLLGSTQFVF